MCKTFIEEEVTDRGLPAPFTIQTKCRKYFAAHPRTCSKMQGSGGVWGSKDPVDRKWIAIWWEPTRKLTSHDGSYIFSFILGDDVFLYLAHNVDFHAGGVDWVHRDLWKRVLWAALQKVRVKILVLFVTNNFSKYSNLYHHQFYDNEVFNPGALLTGLLKHETTAAGVPTPRSNCPPASPPPPDLRNFREALTSSPPPPQATPWAVHRQETRSHRTTVSRPEVDEARMLGLTTCPRLSQPLATLSQHSTASTTSSGRIYWRNQFG